MSTSYHIYTKAPAVADSASFARSLRRFGVVGFTLVEHPSYPDRGCVSFEGTVIDILNERRSIDRSDDPEEPEYGYDFDLAFWVEFEEDTPGTRQMVLGLAESVATLYPTLVLYNGYEVVASNSGPGTALEVVKPEPAYVVEGVVDSPSVALWRQHNPKDSDGI